MRSIFTLNIFRIPNIPQGWECPLRTETSLWWSFCLKLLEWNWTNVSWSWNSWNKRLGFASKFECFHRQSQSTCLLLDNEHRPLTYWIQCPTNVPGSSFTDKRSVYFQTANCSWTRTIQTIARFYTNEIEATWSVSSTEKWSQSFNLKKLLPHLKGALQENVLE